VECGDGVQAADARRLWVHLLWSSRQSSTRGSRGRWRFRVPAHCGGNVRGLARLAVSSGTRELTLEVAATGDLFFAMEEGTEFEFNPPCGSAPRSAPLPGSSSLQAFGFARRGFIHTHSLLLRHVAPGRADPGAAPLGAVQGAPCVADFRALTRSLESLVSTGMGLAQVLSRTTLALALCVETPGTVPGRNMFVGILEMRGPSL